MTRLDTHRAPTLPQLPAISRARLIRDAHVLLVDWLHAALSDDARECERAPGIRAAYNTLAARIEAMRTKGM